MTTKETQFFLEIAVFTPLRQTFTYLSSKDIRPGCRVQVSFGRRQLVGVTLNSTKQNPTTLSISKIKHISKQIDETPIISERMLTLLKWASRYYHHAIGEVISAALPVKMRDIHAKVMPAQLQSVEINGQIDGQMTSNINDDHYKEIIKTLLRAPKQRKIIETIHEAGNHMLLTRLKQEININSASLKSLIDKQYIRISERPPSTEMTINTPQIALNTEQNQAVEQILNKANQFHPFLLQGITGSGKTEVYLAVAQALLKKGKQSLILVPEIALSPQLVQRFTKRFGDNVCVSHSALNDSERYQSWWRARENHSKIILGTRSAIFTPMAQPGIIIIDEEHDTSYKQQDGFRYHARDLAVKRASQENIPIVLGSATPSLESKANAQAKRYTNVFLNHRIGNALLPKMHCIDTKKFRLLDGLTVPLIEALKTRIEKKQQAILFLNRRGYAPVAQCSDCGWQAHCSSCDAFLTYHQTQNRLRCHHCHRTVIAPNKCPKCESELLFIGIGTQRIEAALNEHIPEARVLRLDRDNITTQQKLDDALNAIRQNKVDIIVGTQLIVKGHDFPNVTLVGVINSDHGLYSVDFRATEYLFQQLVQVAGRAGRADLRGEVMIQTAHPENEDLQFILNQDYEQFATHCLTHRKMMNFPPYSHAAIWRAEAIDQNMPIAFLNQIKAYMQHIIEQNALSSVTLFDAVDAPARKRIGHYRAQLFMLAENRQQLHTAVQFCLDYIQTLKITRKLRWSIDIDPIDMY